MPVDDTVFEVVQGFADRFNRDSKALPAQTSFTPVTAVLCFTTLGVELAIHLEELAEMLEVPDYTRLPKVKPWVLGVASVRGKLLPVIDFAQYLGGESSATPKSQRVLVIDEQGIYIGLLVDRVSGVRHFDTEKFSSDPADMTSALKHYVAGCFADDDGKIKHLFRPALLVTDKSFQDVVI
ncbi:MAG: hypothetical protein DRR42_13910 [Gammaproteobacteria bacterium]|nr:MAG: hypothetical protein DRR42_13910 [Gammaproteobacteria bacterium]